MFRLLLCPFINIMDLWCPKCTVELVTRKSYQSIVRESEPVFHELANMLIREGIQLPKKNVLLIKFLQHLLNTVEVSFLVTGAMPQKHLLISMIKCPTTDYIILYKYPISHFL